MTATEHQAQAALVQWLAAKGVLAMAIPNSARRNPRQAAWLRAEGMIAGAPDLILSQLSRGRPVAIEMKRAKGSRVGGAQAAVHAVLRHHGWVVLVCWGLDDALVKLSHAYGWPEPPRCSSSSPQLATKRARGTGRRIASGATSTPAISPPRSRSTPTRAQRVDLP